jgi:hypothetical protein
VRSPSDEAKLFGRMAVFGLAVGAGYWLLTGERAGTVLLVAFGAASLIAAIAVFIGSGRRGGGAAAATAATESVPEPVPEPGWAPLGIAAGLGAVAVGAAFGPWLMIAGVLVAIVGGLSWLAGAMREADDVTRAEPPRP